MANGQKERVDDLYFRWILADSLKGLNPCLKRINMGRKWREARLLWNRILFTPLEEIGSEDWRKLVWDLVVSLMKRSPVVRIQSIWRQYKVVEQYDPLLGF